MTEFEADPGEAIAADLMEYLNETPLSLGFDAEKPEDMTAAYKLERPSLTLLLAPFDEEAEHIDRGGTAREVFRTNIVVTRNLSAEFSRDRLSRFAREVKLAIRGKHLNLKDHGSFKWVGDETPVKYDPEHIRQQRRFTSIIRILHLGIT